MTNTFETLFTILFVSFNAGYAIISTWFVKPWGENILFKTDSWSEGIELMIPFKYYHYGAAGLCWGISIMALFMYNDKIPLTVRSSYYFWQILNWISWTVFEVYYFAMGYTRTPIAVIQIFLCLLALLLAFFAFRSLKDEIARLNIVNVRPGETFTA